MSMLSARIVRCARHVGIALQPRLVTTTHLRAGVVEGFGRARPLVSGPGGEPSNDLLSAVFGPGGGKSNSSQSPNPQQRSKSNAVVKIDIDPSMFGMLIGRQGSNIKSLQEAARAAVHVDREANQIVVVAAEDSIDHAVKIVEDDVKRIKARSERDSQSWQKPTPAPKESVSEEGEETKLLQVEGSLIGALIGRGGSTLKELMDKTNTKIYIDMRKQDSESKDVLIKGSKDAVEAAAKLVTEQMDESRATRREREILIFSNQEMGAIIGRGGQQISRVKDETGAHINIVPRDDDDGEDTAEHADRELVLRGTAPQLEAAKVMINQIVSEFRDGVERRAADVSELLPIPDSAVSAVIGKGGQMVREIKSQSGASVSVSAREDTQPNGDRTVRLWGTPDAVAKAKELIAEVIKGQDDYDDDGGGGGGEPRRRYERFGDSLGRRGGGERGPAPPPSFASISLPDAPPMTAEDESGMVDVEALLAELKDDGLEVDEDTRSRLGSFADILSLNPDMSLPQKRELLRMHAQDSMTPITQDWGKLFEEGADVELPIAEEPDPMRNATIRAPPKREASQRNRRR